MKTEKLQVFKVSISDLQKVLLYLEGSSYLAIGDEDLFIVGCYGLDHPEDWAEVVKACPFLAEANPNITTHLHR